MGSSSSRLVSPSISGRSRGGLKRRLSSLLICGAGDGASTSNHAPTIIDDMDDYPAELLACSYEGSDPLVVDGLQSSMKEHSPILRLETECSHSTVDISSCNSNNTIEPLFPEYCPRPVETSNDKKCLSKRKELVPDLLNVDHNSVVPYFERTNEIGSSSFVEQQPPIVASLENNLIAIVEDDTINEGGSQVRQEGISSSNSSHRESGDLRGIGASPSHNPANGSPVIRASDPAFVPRVPDLLFSPQSGVGTAREEAAPVPGLFTLDSEHGRSDGGVLHVDVVSISSSALFSSSGEGSSHEARRNSRRLFWDAFSRRGSRRHSDSRTIVFSSEDSDDLGSHDRWLLNFSGDLFEDGIGSESGLLGSRSRGRHEGRWHSRSEIWERFRGGLDESSRRTTTFCASGLHPDGTCSCQSFLMTEESSTRGSISRIVMLAEALFEVLDEIHRQPMSLSLPMVSVPAPESVVNSFPLKSHKKPNAAKSSDQDVEQCYICLAEYEEGDKIRVLPCRHEYHMSCVDKWLKEIHGVCPLCRGDVCAGSAEGSSVISNS